LLVPVYEAHLGTAWSLDKHMSAGTWFLALAAGYAASRIPRPATKPVVAAVAGLALFAYPAITGLWLARSTFHTWANTASLVRTLRPIMAGSGTRLLTNDNQVLSYYLPAGLTAGRIVGVASTSTAGIAAGSFTAASIDLTNGSVSTQNPASADAEMLQLTAGNSVLHSIVGELERSSLYRLTAILPYSTSNPSESQGVVVVWRRVAQTATRPTEPQHRRSARR
jgi:hypothetical protein